MIPEIGHFALILAFLVALTQAVVPLVGAQRGDGAWMAAARPMAVAQFLFIAIGFAALTYAYVVSDYSVVNVAENSNASMPMLYKVTGVWGNHEGSLLLWVLILALYGLGIALFGRNLPAALRARVLSVQAMISIGFLAFLLFTSNPFLRFDPAPLVGRDLNPLLQDPGLAFHPPFLYLGYVGFSITFSFAVAALIEGRVDAAWARWVRPWTLAAWAFLTLGVAMGSWWAYYELGWGGFWFWDPVENSSFMPWIAGTALLHSAIVTEKRDTLKSWTILLAILTFSLSLLGTFLVRSGVLTSVHAFATDPSRGLFILIFLFVVIGGSLSLYAARAPQLKTGGLFAPISREGSLVLNNVLLATACATVLLGTLYPLLLDALGGGKVSVGPPYFDATFGPIMVPMLILTAIGPLMPWKRADLRGVMSRLKFAFVGSLIAGAAGWYFTTGVSPLPAFGMAIAGWIFIGTLIEFAERIKLFRTSLAKSWLRAWRLPRSAWGMTIAHLGLAIVLAGIIGAQSWRVEKLQVLKAGDTVAIAGYNLRFDGVSETPGPNYVARRGTFVVTRDGKEVTRMYPERRVYGPQSPPTTEAAIYSNGLADLYVVISDPVKGGGYGTRIYFNPLVPWMWFGGVVLVLGAFVSLTDRRHRIGAPSRRRRPAPGGAKPQAA